MDGPICCVGQCQVKLALFMSMTQSTVSARRFVNAKVAVIPLNSDSIVDFEVMELCFHDLA